MERKTFPAATWARVGVFAKTDTPTLDGIARLLDIPFEELDPEVPPRLMSREMKMFVVRMRMKTAKRLSKAGKVASVFADF